MLKTALNLMGALGVLIGVSIIVSNVFFVRPQVDLILANLDQDLELLDLNLDITNQSDLFARSLLGIGEVSSKLTNLLPETIVTLKGTLDQGAYALERVGSTLDSLEKGITGIILPKSKIGRNISSLQKVSSQLRLLAGMTQAMEPLLRQLSQEAQNASQAGLQLQSHFIKIATLMKELKEQTQSARNTIRNHLVTRVFLGAGFLYSALYFFLGGLFFALASIYGKLESLDRFVPVLAKESKNLKKVA